MDDQNKAYPKVFLLLSGGTLLSKYNFSDSIYVGASYVLCIFKTEDIKDSRYIHVNVYNVTSLHLLVVMSKCNREVRFGMACKLKGRILKISLHPL
jgi:hypothetical protein